MDTFLCGAVLSGPQPECWQMVTFRFRLRYRDGVVAGPLE